MTIAPRFRHTGVILLRTTTDPGDLDLPDHVDLNDPASVAEDGIAWLQKVWERPDIREAVRIASAALANRVGQLLDQSPVEGGPRRAKDMRRALVSVASYLARWKRRATPFGVFAGVTTASIGSAAADVGTQHRAIARADAGWLTTLVDQLNRHRGLRPRLTVVVDSALVMRDGRVIVPTRAAATAAEPGAMQDASVRLTRPVQFALAAAAAPIRFDDLTARLIHRFPTAAETKVRELMHGLVDAGLLVTNLRAPATRVDALAHLIEVLRTADPIDLPDVAPLVNELVAVHAEIAQHNTAHDRSRADTIRHSVTARMTALAPTAQVLALDTRLDARVSVPEQVLMEATLAASVLLRTSTQPFGTAAWMDYQARFLSRYGPGALVPVRELLAESGLGYPTGYLGAPRARPAWRTWTERDAALAALIQEALISGADEVNLTDGDIDALTVGDHGDVVPPERIEIGVNVLAPTRDAVNRGRFQLRITSAPRVPTSMAGRFAALLDEPDRTRLAATYITCQDAMAVQLSFPPRRPRNDNIVRTPPLLPDVLSLSEHPVPGLGGDLRLVGVDDLAVTADATQLYLVHIPTGRRVAPRVPHALDTQVHTPPLARFIAEVAEARSAVFRGFDLGSARTLPYIPRIRYHRTILCPARWLLAPEDLRGQHGFDEALTAWRQRWRVPAQVVLFHGELRTPLDLDQQLDRELLRAQLHRADRVELHEANPPGSDGWIGRPAELLLPMTALHPPARPLPATSSAGAVHRPGNSAVLHAQLIGNPARFDEIITAHLPRLVDALGDTVARWWMRRHRDMIRPDTDQHIALVVRLAAPSDYGAAAAVMADFAADLSARGLPHHLLLAPHHEHTPRYGTGPALEAAERVFAADTLAARAQITAATESGIPAQAWAAASMTRLTAAFAPEPLTGCRALLACLPQTHGPLDRRLREHAVSLASDQQTARTAPGGADVVDAWTARDVALTAYHRTLATQRDPAGVLRTLLHEHHIRAVGVDPTLEQETGRLARAAAQRRLAPADVQ